MKTTMNYIFLTLLLTFSASNFAMNSKVAKVIILKGEVKAKLKSNDIIDLKKGTWLPEGAQVKTSKSSFVKLLFIDKSQMNLGPNSQMIINKFPKKKAGIITLMKGSLRSKVTKDYMQMDKSREKLYIKTKSAAMGVRGTDFEVSYKNGKTATHLYEGRLVVRNLDQRTFKQDMSKVFSNQKKLTPIVAGQMAVFKGKKSPPAVLRIPAKIMKEATQTGGKKGSLKTLSKSSIIKLAPKSLLLPGTKTADVVNEKEKPSSKRGPASVNKTKVKPKACALNGCGSNTKPKKPEFRDPCVKNPAACRAANERAKDNDFSAGNFCDSNPTAPQCGGGNRKTNVRFNISAD